MMENKANFFGIDVPMVRLIGLQPEHVEEGNARTRLIKKAEILNSRGDIQGGTLMTALDLTLAAAARGHDPVKVAVITIEMNSHFLRPAQTDVTIRAKVLRRGKNIAFCEGEVLDANNHQVCVARGTFKLA
jgi:uncharacterized protein (TIGR00369 family)